MREGPYVTATVSASSCLRANAFATAALLWGDEASYHIAQARLLGTARTHRRRHRLRRRLARRREERVIALTSPYLWYTSRATGLVALVLFTAVVTLGTLVATRVGGKSVGRFELNELHRSLSIVAMIFLFFHIVTTVLDTYAPTGWLSAVIPFASSYDRLGVAIGAVAFDFMLAVWISSLLKARVKPESWRFIHWFSWVAYVSAILHAYLTGADTKSGAGLILVILCAIVVAVASLWRFFARPASRRRGERHCRPSQGGPRHLAASKGAGGRRS